MTLSQPENKPPLIHIQHASVMRDKTLALDDFCLSINQGESLAILGPNGAGKSTLLKLISREVYPLVKDETKVEILGKADFVLADYQQHLGLISQDLQDNYEPMTPGLEVVISGIFASNSLWQHHQVSNEHVQLAETLMQQLNISDLADRPFGQLSTGQQRRLLLARALIHHPDTLILDEPTSGMDLKACFQYMQTLEQLIQDRKAIVLVTHHLHEIPKSIQRVVLIKNGQVQFDGAKEQALTGENLSQLFETQMSLVSQNGLYQAFPGKL